MGRIAAALLVLTAFQAAACRPAPPASPGARVQAEEAPEHLLGGMDAQSFGDGGLEWRLISPRGANYVSRNLMVTDQVTAQLYENGQKSTTVTAARAMMNTGRRTIPAEGRLMEGVVRPLSPGDMFLTGQVVIVSSDSTRLETDWLHYDRGADLILSTAAVRMTRGSVTTNGVGLEAKSDLSNLKIFNQTLVVPEAAVQDKPRPAKPSRKGAARRR